MSESQTPDGKATSDVGSLPQLKGFKILSELGRTPKGIIYKCKRDVEGDVVAVKVYRRSLCEKQFVDRVTSNSEKAFFLDAGGLAKCLGCINEDGNLLLIAEYASGQPLSKVLHKQMRLNTGQILSIALQCARALKYSAAHGCNHGRLHPADVILGEKTVRMTGVGLGERPEHAAWAPKDPYIFEPLIYTAPEAMPSKKFPEDPAEIAAADVYSLGALTFHLLTLKAPFQGGDEAALTTEREKLGRPVIWPSDAQVPPNVMEVVEKMMAANPKDRPTFEQLVSTFTRALAAVQATPKIEGKSDAPSAEVAGMRPAISAAEARKKQESNKNITPAKKTGSGEAKAVASATSAPKSWLKDPGAAVTRSEDTRAAKAEKMYTSVLLVMTAIILLSVVVVSKIFLIDPLRNNQQASAQPKTQPSVQQPAVTPPVTNTPVNATPPVLTAQNKEPFNVPADPNGDPRSIAARQLALIQEMLQKGEIQYSPALLKVVKSIPDRAGRDSSAGVRAMLLATEIEETLNAGGVRPPVNQLTVSTQPPQPAPPVQAPVTEPKETAKAPEPAPAEKSTVSVDSLKNVIALTKLFKHTDALNELTAMGRTATGDDIKVVAAFTAVIKSESEMVNRSRSRLKEQIEKHPKKESPLQVFPRKNDPQGDDIVDFDDVGLKIAEKKNGEISIRVRQWKNVPGDQAYNMLQLLVDKRSTEDQVGLAAFAYVRGLKAEQDSSLSAARSLQDGGVKSSDLLSAMDVMAKTIELK